ncbi:unnamed protein product [Pseudo-nitzschia multistriata]|uniref:Zeta toxin domain-containing protein n=1 Tax=Pseudo-nitzschia multistriata TaxID=183589 RepID=A0A448ZCS3_9STRA|nr:unnamed protein product [Pseudo-nitzschia multistriata]
MKSALSEQTVTTYRTAPKTTTSTVAAALHRYHQSNVAVANTTSSNLPVANTANPIVGPTTSAGDAKNYRHPSKPGETNNGNEISQSSEVETTNDNDLSNLDAANSKSFVVPDHYDWQRSTEENYDIKGGQTEDTNHNQQNPGNSTNAPCYFGQFFEQRNRLDLSYHAIYVPERQAFQDSIVASMLHLAPSMVDRTLSRSGSTSPVAIGTAATTDTDCTTKPQEEYRENTLVGRDPRPPQWIVFTAGVYGAGKSHTIRKLQSHGCFPGPGTNRDHEPSNPNASVEPPTQNKNIQSEEFHNNNFVVVDPDLIRRKLPEFEGYGAQVVGAATQKEAGMMAELLTDAALSRGLSVLVDGSLRDAAWHTEYFARLRARHQQTQVRTQTQTMGNTGVSPALRIGILYVTAPQEEIYERVRSRQQTTGRGVPIRDLEESTVEVPIAVHQLKPLVDFFVEIHNSQQKQNHHHQQEQKQENENKRQDHGTAKDGDDGDDHDFQRSEAEKLLFSKRCVSILKHNV